MPRSSSAASAAAVPAARQSVSAWRYLAFFFRVEVQYLSHSALTRSRREATSRSSPWAWPAWHSRARRSAALSVRAFWVSPPACMKRRAFHSAVSAPPHSCSAASWASRPVSVRPSPVPPTWRRVVDGRFSHCFV